MKNSIKQMNQTTGDFVFTAVNYFLLAVAVILVFYPVYFVVIASVSDPTYVNSGDFLLYPKGITFLGYQRVFADNRIWIGYGNTLLYTVCGTALGVMASIMAGYSLSRKDLPGRNFFMGIMVFTMYFGGGLIPFYILVKNMNLIDNRLALILFGSVSVFNIIITRSFFVSTLPPELQEAAFIDGCGNAKYFFAIVMPLSKAIIAVIALYIAVAYWNSYFNAMIFITSKSKFPLQLYLREILLTASTQQSAPGTGQDAQAAQQLEKMVEVVKYGVIVVSTVPIICVYPFLQKYFVKGVMIGAIKG